MWDSFRDQLVEAIKEDGFELKFILLYGADHVRFRLYVFHALKTDKLVTSNVTREAKFVTEYGMEARSADFTPWAV